LDTAKGWGKEGEGAKNERKGDLHGDMAWVGVGLTFKDGKNGEVAIVFEFG
jgi:hypothetical protein